MRNQLKCGILHLCKWLGLFILARRFTRRALRILCYHGFALADENAFRPKLFMRPDIFERRLRYLVANGFPVLPLTQALDGLEESELPPGATVITIDDGFYSVYDCALPPLREFSLPATVYVTSYNSVKETPVFRLVVQYMFWKSSEAALDTTSLGISRRERVSLRDSTEKDRVMWEIIRFGEEGCTEPQRSILAAALGKQLRVEYERVIRERFLSLMTPPEIRQMATVGIDVQLHTHRHRLPDREELVRKEILDNRAVLEPLTGRTLHHLCYPSGLWSKRQWPWLAVLDIRSGTTCDPGLNYRQSPRLGLKRFLDADDISQIEFEAEMCGFLELLRGARRPFRHPANPTPHD